MKKSFLLTLVAVVMGMTAFAQSTTTKTLSYEQRGLRDKIQSYLKSEGFQPTIDNDGDLSFKYQGGTYYVVVSDKDSSPMFVTLMRVRGYDEHITRTKIAMYATEVNKYKMLKVLDFEKSYELRVELFCTNATAFTSIFYKIIGIMVSASTEINNM